MKRPSLAGLIMGALGLTRLFVLLRPRPVQRFGRVADWPVESTHEFWRHAKARLKLPHRFITVIMCKCLYKLVTSFFKDMDCMLFQKFCVKHVTIRRDRKPPFGDGPDDHIKVKICRQQGGGRQIQNLPQFYTTLELAQAGH